MTVSNLPRLSQRMTLNSARTLGSPPSARSVCLSISATRATFGSERSTAAVPPCTSSERTERGAEEDPSYERRWSTSTVREAEGNDSLSARSAGERISRSPSWPSATMQLRPGEFMGAEEMRNRA